MPYPPPANFTKFKGKINLQISVGKKGTNASSKLTES